MKTILLKRISLIESHAFGVLIDQNFIPFAVTMEPPWKENQQNISCIPAGVYICKRVNSPKFGITFEITSVPNRHNVLFHWGNVVKDTHGCVVVAEKFGILKNEPAVLESHFPNEGFNELMLKMKDEKEFILNISECV